MKLTTLYYLDPEVAGDFGDHTIISNADTYRRGEEPVPRVANLVYEFDCWQGDELLQAFPCYIASRNLISQMRSAGLSGISDTDLTVTTTPTFDQLHIGLVLPEFSWLVPTGKVVRFFKRITPSKAGVADGIWSGHDVCLGPKGELLVTARAIEIIGVDRVSHSTIQPVLVVE